MSTPSPTPLSSPTGTTAQGYAFGPFRLDPASYRLTRDGAEIDLTSKAFDVLLHLLREPHRVVTKEELLAAVWPGTTVTDDSLIQCVSSLRRTLGDEAANPVYIATVARRGYRFIGPVTEWVEHIPRRVMEPSLSDPNPAADDAPHPQPTIQSRAGVWPTTLVAASLAVVALAGGWYMGARAERTAVSGVPAGLLRFSQSAPAGSALASGGALSPDGTQIAFSAEDASTGVVDLWVRRLDAASPRKLEGTSGAARPFWSPDGRLIGFVANGRLRTIALDGGTPTDVVVVGSRFSGASWSTSGQILYSTWLSGLYAIPSSGGTPEKIFDVGQGEITHAWPHFLPDGDHFLFSVYGGDRGGVNIGQLSTRQRTRLLEADAGAIYSPAGYVVFTRTGILTAQPFDAARQTLTGEPVALIPGNVEAPSMTNGTMLSAGGRLLALGGASGESELVWFDRAGRRLGTVDAPVPLHNLSLSPGGSTVFGNTYPPVQTAVWASDLDRGTSSPIVNNATIPTPAPDGRTLAHATNDTNGVGVFAVDLNATGAAPTTLLNPTAERKTPIEYTPDGSSVLYSVVTARGDQDLLELPLTGDRSPRVLLSSPANEIQGRVSPDLRWLAFASDESGRWEVYVQSFPDARSKITVSVGGGTEPFWRGDGRELFYLAADRSITAVDVTPGASIQVGRPRSLFRALLTGEATTYRSHYVVSRDGQRFLVDSLREPARDSITLLLDWAGRRP